MSTVRVVAPFVFIDRLDKEVRIITEQIAYDDLLRRGKNVKKEVKRLIRERAEENTPGGLADSVEGDISDTGRGTWLLQVFSEKDHATWFEVGTGIEGPQHVYIFPKGSNKIMYFVPRGMTEFVRAQRTRGQEPHNAFRDGLEAFRR